MILAVRIYLIGAGVIARAHAAAAKLPEPAALRVADPNPAALESFRDAYPEAAAFDDAAKMLASEPARDDDIVIVATPPFLHLTGYGSRSAPAATRCARSRSR
ncbi:Gfo/Idh/MocA family oxidoreductase [Paenibacillus sp.]|uniref:Gfo/Idh/MocA family oxidoreductase n=1 Tax=Paenibacillus sp. TaxID=58172 RepID=UPI002811CDB8|nr:Gfo/Idh/MocA family oxidoreductase [Paenibacillus sp.]